MFKLIKQHLYFLTIALTVTLVSCTREDDTLTINTVEPASLTGKATSVNENGNSAAAHIAASEKLVIPAAVALPLDLPAGNSRVATFFATGIQQYKAREIPGSNPISYQWVLAGPDAILYNAQNHRAGTHGFGPYWELSPGDSIWGQHFNPVKTAPSSDPESVDWLLLMPKNGTAPTGVFANVSYIQRIATKGGKAPMTPPMHANEVADVKYMAVYRFSKKN